MQDLQQSTNINNFDQTEEVFKQEFIEGVATFSRKEWKELRRKILRQW